MLAWVLPRYFFEDDDAQSTNQTPRGDSEFSNGNPGFGGAELGDLVRADSSLDASARTSDSLEVGVRPRGSPSAFTSARSLGETEDGEHFEDSTCSCFRCCHMVQNMCVPFYWKCVCSYHICRSIPAPCIVSLTAVAVGFTFLRYYFADLSDRHLVGTDINVDFVRVPLDTYGLLLLIGDSAIAVSSALLTGWTKEALCRSMTSGIFEYRPGARVECGCGCWSTCVQRFAWILLTLLVVFAYGSIFLSLIGVFVNACAWFVGFCMVTACRMGMRNDIGDDGVGDGDDEDPLYRYFAVVFFEVISNRLSAEDIGGISSESRYRQYCGGRKRKILNDLSLMVIGQFLILAGQIQLFTISWDNHRVARTERARAINPGQSFTSPPRLSPSSETPGEVKTNDPDRLRTIELRNAMQTYGTESVDVEDSVV